MTFIVLAQCFNCIAQIKNDNDLERSVHLGMRVSSLLTDGRMEFESGYGFSSHWTIEGNVSISTKASDYKWSEEEKLHYTEFSESFIRSRPDDGNVFTGGFGISYWVRERNSGPYFNIGGEYGDRTGLMADIGIGYMFHIWNILYVSLSYNMNIPKNAHVNDEGTWKKVGISIRIII